MEAPILQITVLEGPRNGEILVCEPKSKIHIGRVMKGNKMALRDPGISQKHLCFQFIQEDSRWFVSDLNTSNGTILNGSPIQASVLVPVSDGDVLQIGEKTKLGVKIVTPSVRVLEEKEDVKRRVTRRGGSLRVNNSSGVSEETQSRGQGNNVGPISAGVSDSGIEMGQKGRGTSRRNIVTRNSARVLEQVKEDLVMSSYSETKESDQPKVRRNPRPRRDNSSRVLKESDANCKVEDVGMKRNGTGKASTVIVSEEERKNKENLVLEIDSKSSYVAIPELRKGIEAKTSADSSMAIEDKEGVDIGVKEGGDSNRVDFENMTLEEWFDSMELFLPKVIHEESERIIGILREKATKFDELMEAA